MNEFKNKIVDMINNFDDSQEEILHDVSKVIVAAIKNGGKFYVVGTGHSHMVGEEFYARAGGLGCVHLIAPAELTLGEHPLKSTMIERVSEYANIIIMQYKIKEGDVVMISSNSGRNNMPVEMAIELNKRKVTTIGFTSLNHSKTVDSRHQSGLRLFEVCDYVIDNCGEVGDAMIQLNGVKGKMGSSSSVIGIYLAQMLSMLIAKEMVSQGMIPPVFLSANVDAGDTWNKDIMEEYYKI